MFADLVRIISSRTQPGYQPGELGPPVPPPHSPASFKYLYFQLLEVCPSAQNIMNVRLECDMLL